MSDNPVNNESPITSREIDGYTVVGLIIAIIIICLMGYCSPLSESSKKAIIRNEIVNIVYDKEQKSKSLGLPKTVEILTRSGSYKSMYRISQPSKNDIYAQCATGLSKGQVDTGRDIITDASIRGNLVKCVDNYLTKTPVESEDVLFILSDPRILENIDYKPLAENFEAFKKIESPTYSNAYDLYSLLDKAFESKFDKEISQKKVS